MTQSSLAVSHFFHLAQRVETTARCTPKLGNPISLTLRSHLHPRVLVQRRVVIARTYVLPPVECESLRRRLTWLWFHGIPNRDVESGRV